MVPLGKHSEKKSLNTELANEKLFKQQETQTNQ